MITGNSIKELSEITELSSNDLFVIAEPSIYDKSIKFNKKTTLSTLYNLLSVDIFSRFGDMIFETSSDYSLSGHTHNDKYNKINDMFSYFGGYVPNTESDISIGQYFLSGLLKTLYIPISCVNSKDYIIKKSIVEPPIGSLMFQLAGNLDSDSGWVLADGSTYEGSQYKHSERLMELYGYNEYNFRVPLISNFIKINSSMRKSYPDAYGQNVIIPMHQHTINITLTSNINLTATISCSSTQGDGAYAHNGKDIDPKKNTKKITSGIYYLNIKPNIITQNFSVNYNEINNTVYPNHYKSSVYVYIGDKS